MKNLVIVAVFLGLIGMSGEAQNRPPIIDMHMHARPAGKPQPRPCAPQPCVSSPAAYVGEDGPLRGTLEAMERYNIVRGFLSDTPENVERWIKAAPGKFLPSWWIPAQAGTTTFPEIDTLRQAHAMGRLKGVGEIITQYSGIPPTDPRLEPYFALAEELDLPVLIHATGFGAPLSGFRLSAGHPLALDEVLVRHPKLRLYFENAGYPFLDEAIALMTQRPQVYADLSTITWYIPRPAFHSYLRGLVDAGLGRRVMWGSDQMSWPEVIVTSIAAIETADFLSTEQKRDILHDNAARFLRLDLTSAR